MQRLVLEHEFAQAVEDGPSLVDLDAADEMVSMSHDDVGTCIEAGTDPIEWVKANPGRIKLTHLKELQRRIMFGDKEFLDISKDKALLQLEITELDDASYDTEMLGFNAEELKEIQASLEGLEDGFGEDEAGEIEEADTTARIGSYSFTIEREPYLEWLEKLKQEIGFEKKDIIAELKKRLGL